MKDNSADIEPDWSRLLGLGSKRSSLARRACCACVFLDVEAYDSCKSRKILLASCTSFFDKSLKTWL